MKDFKVGDKVVVVKKYQGLPAGSIWVVKSFSDIGTVSLVGGTGFWNTSRFELFKENPLGSFNLKVDPWKIRTGTPEISRLTQLWLFEQGIDWKISRRRDEVQDFKEDYLTNCQGGKLSGNIYYGNTSFQWDSLKQATEIKLEFETIVKSVTLIPQPPKKTESEIQLEELLSEIAALNAKADIIKNSMESK
ncbi:hypothetical protein [Pseudomonas sp.]|uniref:hypothetical protein n=1 Tax=Pseudomonas sp. TaxID=306 RepID=UPI003FD6E249